MLRYTVKLTLNQYFMKYSERKISQRILPFNLITITNELSDNNYKRQSEFEAFKVKGTLMQISKLRISQPSHKHKYTEEFTL